MKRAGKIHIDQRGFSMIEMVMVLIVMAIMATFIMIRTTTGNDLIAQSEILKSHLRYRTDQGNERYRRQHPAVGVFICPITASYTLYRNNATANDILPGETAQTHTLPTGITVSTNCANSTCNFNEWGSPGATTLTMTLTQGASTSTISITKNTGFVN